LADGDGIFFKPHAKRGYKAIEDTFEEGLPNATLVTDRHAAYFNMDVKNHQICLVHLQRNLTYLTEAQPDNQWPKDMLELITDAMKQRKEKAWGRNRQSRIEKETGQSA
jgi:transposase